MASANPSTVPSSACQGKPPRHCARIWVVPWVRNSSTRRMSRGMAVNTACQKPGDSGEATRAEMVSLNCSALLRSISSTSCCASTPARRPRLIVASMAARCRFRFARSRRMSGASLAVAAPSPPRRASTSFNWSSSALAAAVAAAWAARALVRCVSRSSSSRRVSSARSTAWRSASACDNWPDRVAIGDCAAAGVVGSRNGASSRNRASASRWSRVTETETGGRKAGKRGRMGEGVTEARRAGQRPLPGGAGVPREKTPGTLARRAEVTPREHSRR